MFNQGLFQSVIEFGTWQEKVDSCVNIIVTAHAEKVGVPLWFEVAYKRLPESITRFVSNQLLQSGYCDHTLEQRKLIARAHKWAHIPTVCQVPTCKHTGASLKAICNQGVQNNEQRSRPWTERATALTAFDAAEIF